MASRPIRRGSPTPPARFSTAASPRSCWAATAQSCSATSSRFGDGAAAVFAHRDAAEAAAQGSQPLPAAMLSIDLAEVRRRGAEAASREAVAHLAREDLAGFWIHLHADVHDA